MATPHEEGTVNLSGSLDTETTLNTTNPETTDGVFQFWVDLSNMAAGDVTIIRVYEKVKSAGTARVCESAVINGATIGTNNKIWESRALMLLYGWKFTIEQTDGSGRSYDWGIRKA